LPPNYVRLMGQRSTGQLHSKVHAKRAPQIGIRKSDLLEPIYLILIRLTATITRSTNNAKASGRFERHR
jgi:hypothetical protein